MRLLQKIKDHFLRAKDISGERLLEHLKNIGIEAEKIPTGSADDPFSIRLQGLNIDVIQLSFYTTEYSTGYQIDYIVRGYERDKWHLREKLERLGDSSTSWSVLYMKRTVWDVKTDVKLDKKNRCIRMYGFILPEEKIVVEEGGKRVKYRYLKDTELPSRETIEYYDRIASRLRMILEGG